MAGETNLETLLASMSPRLMADEYVFCTVENTDGDYQALQPLATFREAEGLTMVLSKQMAVTHKLSFESVFKGITLSVHSSLDAVGLTAAVATKLAQRGISANVIAAYYHDHIFVQVDKAEQAMLALAEFSQ